jgi:hypothetical protein
MNYLDHDELAARSRRYKRKQQRDLVWNVLTGLALLATFSLVAVLALIFSNPAIGLNPFPPPTMPVLVDLSTPTPSLVFLPATWTPAAATATSQTVPTSTPAPISTDSPTLAPPTFAPTQADGVYPFALESNPIAMAGTVFHTDGDCNWQGVAGRVVDLQGRPVIGMRVKLTGIYNGKSIELTTLTGGASAWYGESGFEFVLGDKPYASTQSLAIQLNDQSFLPISEQVIFDTYATCDKNLILINFKQVR